MKGVLDHCVPRVLSRELPGHEIVTAREAGWDGLSNGKLMAAACDAGYSVLITVDRNLVHQQPPELPIAVVVLHCADNTIDSIKPLVPALLHLLQGPMERRAYFLGAVRK